ncbi:MAG: hypothetical protein QM753_15700 [Thermomicrobiales bacterium]
MPRPPSRSTSNRKKASAPSTPSDLWGRAPAQEIAAQLDLLRSVAADPVSLRATATEFARHSGNLEVVKAAIAALGGMGDAGNRDMLHEVFHRCGERNDAGGFIRAAVVRALQPIVSEADRPLLMTALATYQTQGMYEICGDLRTAALVTMNDLDPDLAAYFAATFLQDPGNAMSGQPGTMAIRVLAAQQKLELLYALASWGQGLPELLGEALRNLIELPPPLIDRLVERYRGHEDEQVVLGFFDLLLGHPERARWHGEVITFLETTDMMDIYGIIVMQIVASRDDDLIDALRRQERIEPSRRKAELLQLALQNA